MNKLETFINKTKVKQMEASRKLVTLKQKNPFNHSNMPVSRKTIDPLQKAIPRNPKYDNIISTIDTGASLNRYLTKMEEFQENFKVRDNELFKRMKLTTFVQLILQIYETENKFSYNDGNGCGDKEYNACSNENKKLEDTSTVLNTRSTLENLIGGLGEHDVALINSKTIGDKNIMSVASQTLKTSISDYPYLLLDVRERDDYDACHIITAKSYPIAMLSRSVNYETQEMLAFRNKPNYIILLYDEDERLAPRAATTLVQRGYANVFLLSGGLKLAWKLFPRGLIIGEMPHAIYHALKLRSKRRLPKSALAADCPSNLVADYLNRADVGDTLSMLSIDSVSRSTTSRTNTTLAAIPKVYCEIGSRDRDVLDGSDGCEEFVPQDLMHLTLHMEKHAIDRKSVRSTSTRTTLLSVRQSTKADRKPFR